MSGIALIGRSGAAVQTDNAGHVATTFRPHHPATSNGTSAGPQVRGSGSYRNFSTSGSLGALAANSEVWHFRFPIPSGSSALSYSAMIMRKLQVSIMVSTAASGAALLSLGVFFSRSWSVDGSGGTLQSVGTLNNSKQRINNARPYSTVRIANTTALTAGTQTLDAQPLSSVAFGVGTGATTTSIATQLLNFEDGTLIDDDPWALAYPPCIQIPEGLVIRTGANAFPAGIAWTLSVRSVWQESETY